MRWHRLALAGAFAIGWGCGSGTEDDGACQTDDYGTIMIELHRGAAAATDVFTGTESIAVYVEYEDCLADFYTEEHPEHQQEGVDGGALFDAWMNGCTCDGSYSGPVIECSVLEMEQTFNTQGATDSTFLRIRYDVTGDGLEGMQIPVGPLPKEGTTTCPPLVRVGSVYGFDGMDNEIWKAVTFDDPTAKVGQGAPVRVDVE